MDGMKLTETGKLCKKWELVCPEKKSSRRIVSDITKDLLTADAEIKETNANINAPETVQVEVEKEIQLNEPTDQVETN